MNYGNGENVYTGIGPLLPRGPANPVNPAAIGEYLGSTTTEIARAYDGKQLLPISIPGIDNLGHALNPGFSLPIHWDVVHGMRIAELGKKLFSLFGTHVVPPSHAKIEYAARIYAQSPLVPVTEHVPGDASISYGVTFTSYMTKFGKHVRISTWFLQTEDGKKEFIQQLDQMSNSYVITALATIVHNVMVMPETFAEWSSNFPSVRRIVPPRKLLSEWSQLFATIVKKNTSAMYTIIDSRCPDANTAFVANNFINNDLFGEMRKDPDLYPSTMYPVYQGDRRIKHIVPIPAFPTGNLDEVKGLTRSQAAYFTFFTLPPSDDGSGAVEIYDYRSRQYVTLTRRELYQNVAFDMVEPGNNAHLEGGQQTPATIYKNKIDGKDDVSKEGFVVLRVFHWEGHAVALCDHTKVTLLTSGTQLQQSTSAAQNMLEVHLKCTLGTFSSDAGASTFLLPIPIVTELAAGGSSKFFTRELLRYQNYQLLDPNVNDRGLIVIRCTKEQIKDAASEMYIPALGSWSPAAMQSFGNDVMRNVSWVEDANANVLQPLRLNIEAGSFAIGSLFRGTNPKMSEVAFRDNYRVIRTDGDALMSQAISGCAPHADLLTDELLGETGLRTRSAMDPSAITKRLKLA